MESTARQCGSHRDVYGSPSPTTSRAARERELAAYHRDCAELAHQKASTADAHDRPTLWNAEAAHREIAMLHDRLGDVYDREDATATSKSSDSSLNGR